jgi:hypothetical protein
MHGTYRGGFGKELIMFGPRWNVLRLFGIPVYIDASWLIVLALLALSFAAGLPSET